MNKSVLNSVKRLPTQIVFYLLLKVIDLRYFYSHVKIRFFLKSMCHPFWISIAAKALDNRLFCLSKSERQKLLLS